MNIINESVGSMPKLICRGCGFVQEYHDTRKKCPKCGRTYRDKIGAYDPEL